MTSTEDDLAIRPLSCIGRTLGDDWVLEHLLGIGGTSTVYAAVNRHGHRAALKILHGSAAADHAARERLLLEAELARVIRHPGAVKVDAVAATADGAPFLIMELLDGCTAESVVARFGNVPLVPALMIADQILDFLAYCHPRGILHRDIKPSNVFITSDGAVKLLDLGVALVSGKQITTRRLAIGTPAYMAPEQATGSRDLDGRCDVFAVGALLFHLLTGQQPRSGRTAHELLGIAAGEPLRRVALLDPELPDDVADLIDRATSYDRTLRWPDAAAMRGAIAAILAKTTHDTGDLAQLATATRDQEDPVPQRDTLPEAPSARILAGTVALRPLAIGG
jgi:eukaryotic-like serine/threonine-protein kinase